MSQAILNVNTDAIFHNWRTLDEKSADNVETAAVVKADGYGLDAGQISGLLSKKNVRTFLLLLQKKVSPFVRLWEIHLKFLYFLV